MNQDQPELTLEESFKQVMQTLPPVIRDYLSQGRYTPVAKSLMAKYGLHIDQAGVLEREIMLLLMGIESPDEFTQALAEEAKLNKETIGSIVQDVNTQIFIPLRAEEMKGVTPPGASEPASHFHLQNKLPPKPVLSPVPPRRDEGQTFINPQAAPQPPARPANIPAHPIAPPPADIIPQPRSIPAAPKVPQAPVKPYSSDPYREPIDEK